MVKNVNIPLGLQLYTVRKELEKDFAGTLNKVAAMGYKTVEFAGYYGIPSVEMKNLLNEAGLQGVSTHVGLETLSSELHKQIEYSLTIGARYIVIPCVAVEQLVDDKEFQALIADLTRIGMVLKSYGLQLVYHNHAFEFTKMDGKYLLDRLLGSISSELLKVELDVYWMTKAGVDKEAYLRKYKGRVPLIHLKDIDKDGNFTEVGHGTIDFFKINEIAKEIGVKYYIVEQDFSKYPLISAQQSLNYLNLMGLNAFE